MKDSATIICTLAGIKKKRVLLESFWHRKVHECVNFLSIHTKSVSCVITMTLNISNFFCWGIIPEKSNTSKMSFILAHNSRVQSSSMTWLWKWNPVSASRENFSSSFSFSRLNTRCMKCWGLHLSYVFSLNALYLETPSQACSEDSFHGVSISYQVDNVNQHRNILNVSIGWSVVSSIKIVKSEVISPIPLTCVRLLSFLYWMKLCMIIIWLPRFG